MNYFAGKSTSTSVKLSLVLPAFNAADIVAGTISTLRQELTEESAGELAGLIHTLEIILVDDGSSDDTASLAEEAGADKVIRLSRNQGKGAAVRTGVLAVSGEAVSGDVAPEDVACKNILVFTDVDLAYDSESIMAVVAQVQRGASPVCVGQRSPASGSSLASDSRLRGVGHWLVGRLTRLVLKKEVADTQCGLKAFKVPVARQLFEPLRLKRFAFDIELFYLMERWGIPFTTQHVQAKERKTSTVRPFRDGLRTAWDILRIARFSKKYADAPVSLPVSPSLALPKNQGQARSPLEKSLPEKQARSQLKKSLDKSPLQKSLENKSLEKIVKSYDIRGVVPQDWDETTAALLGAGFARFFRETTPIENTSLQSTLQQSPRGANTSPENTLPQSLRDTNTSLENNSPQNTLPQNTYSPQTPSAPRMLVGLDMRASGGLLSTAFMEEATRWGMDVVYLGVISTDMLYYASGNLDAPGVIFTASHNPAHYNGIKACLAGAAPISIGSGLERVLELATQGTFNQQVAKIPDAPQTTAHLNPSATIKSGYITSVNVMDGFVEHVLSQVDQPPPSKVEPSKVEPFKVQPFKIIVDCANGMGGLVAPAVLNRLALQVEFLYPELDGSFPNHPADPLKPENLKDLQARVLETGADLGMAFDGDGDRVFFIDDEARPLSGSSALCLLATAALKRNPGSIVLHNAVCSKAVPEAVREGGGVPVCTRVGHSHIKQRMAETKALLGGEHSGHYYFKENYGADSGIIAALKLLELLRESREPLSKLRKPFDRYLASGEHSVSVPDTQKILERMAEVYSDFPQDRLDGLSIDAGEWWCIIRASQTEPLLRINVETEAGQNPEEKLQELLNIIKSSLND